jgi:hypothetical protein
MNAIFKPLLILYHGESQRNSHFPRLLLVLASYWLGRWKAPVHMFHEPATNASVLYLYIQLPALS